jgi:hypothetical protein
MAPGSGSGAPGTGQRAESAAVKGNGFFLSFTVGRFVPTALLVSGIRVSTGAESVANESDALSGSATGRGA